MNRTAANKRYYLKHREEILQKHKDNKDDKDKRKAYYKTYYDKNKDLINEKRRIKYKNNKSKDND